MAVDEAYLRYIVDQLSKFGNFEYRKMFGGVGFFRNRIMFAGIMEGVFRLRADKSSAKDFEQYGMGPWVGKGGKSAQPYFEVPEEVLADRTRLTEWAARAYQAALDAKKS